MTAIDPKRTATLAYIEEGDLMLELIWALLNIRFTLAFVIASICVVLCVWLFPGWPDEYFFGVFVLVMAGLLFAGRRRGEGSGDP